VLTVYEFCVLEHGFKALLGNKRGYSCSHKGYEMLQFNSRNGPVKAKFAYL